MKLGNLIEGIVINPVYDHGFIAEGNAGVLICNRGTDIIFTYFNSNGSDTLI